MLSISEFLVFQIFLFEYCDVVATKYMSIYPNI
jgi:hypothetical protein